MGRKRYLSERSARALAAFLSADEQWVATTRRPRGWPEFVTPAAATTSGAFFVHLPEK
jgi:hypothetical protein